MIQQQVKIIATIAISACFVCSGCRPATKAATETIKRAGKSAAWKEGGKKAAGSAAAGAGYEAGKDAYNYTKDAINGSGKSDATSN